MADEIVKFENSPKKKKRKRAHPWAFPLGLLMAVLSVTGLVTILVAGVNGISSVKDKIARQAAALIPEGSTVFLDGSSTVLRIVNYLREEQNVTVITNSLRAATLLCEKRIKTYCTGGLFVPEALVCVGNYSKNMLESMTADLMFFSSQGLSADGRICDFSENETHQRRLMLDHARKRYFLCDSSKLGKSFLFTVCHVSELDGVLCDVDAAEWLQNAAQQKETP